MRGFPHNEEAVASDNLSNFYFKDWRVPDHKLVAVSALSTDWAHLTYGADLYCQVPSIILCCNLYNLLRWHAGTVQRVEARQSLWRDLGRVQSVSQEQTGGHFLQDTVAHGPCSEPGWTPSLSQLHYTALHSIPHTRFCRAGRACQDNKSNTWYHKIFFISCKMLFCNACGTLVQTGWDDC